LNSQQMIALTCIEVQQNALVVAANAIAERADDKDAAKLLIDAGQAIERAKIEWLQATQRRVQVAPAIPNKLVVEH
jgi:hypothetical protein